MLPGRPVSEKTGAFEAPQLEKKLIAGKGAGGRSQQDPFKVQQSLLNENGRDQQDRFTLEHGADENGQIAELGDKGFHGHRLVRWIASGDIIIRFKINGRGANEGGNHMLRLLARYFRCAQTQGHHRFSVVKTLNPLGIDPKHLVRIGMKNIDLVVQQQILFRH